MVCKYESIELCCSKRTKNHHELKKLPVTFKHQTSLCRGFRSPSKASVNPQVLHRLINPIDSYTNLDYSYILNVQLLL